MKGETAQTEPKQGAARSAGEASALAQAPCLVQVVLAAAWVHHDALLRSWEAMDAGIQGNMANDKRRDNREGITCLVYYWSES